MAKTEENRFSKITVGFVTQNYEEVDGKFVCVSQSFTAGDQVDYENEDGEPFDIDEFDGEEQYQSLDMVTPNNVAVNIDGELFKKKCEKECPSCGADGINDIKWCEKVFEDDVVYQEATCNKCNTRFREFWDYCETEWIPVVKND